MEISVVLLTPLRPVVGKCTCALHEMLKIKYFSHAVRNQMCDLCSNESNGLRLYPFVFDVCAPSCKMQINLLFLFNESKEEKKKPNNKLFESNCVDFRLLVIMR